MAVKLFAQGDEAVCACVCVCVYSAQLQCVTKSLMILCTRVCVWLCVSRWISTDLHALVRHGVIPILQTLRVKRGSREAFHHYAVIYRLFSFSSLLCFILLVKRNLWEKREIFTSTFFFNEFSVEFWKRRRQRCKSGVNHIGVKSLYDMFSGASIFRTAKKDFFKNHVTLLKLKPHRLFLKLFYSWGTWDKKIWPIPSNTHQCKMLRSTFAACLVA